MIKNKIFSRYQKIANNKNNDASDEYYTLYHGFMQLFIELLCRFKKGIQYKVIICPCDSQTSVFRELVKYKQIIGNPKIIYSSYPDKSWEDYFEMDFEKEFNCKPEEVLIFTNPPFKKLAENLRKIKCNFLLFGSNATAIKQGIFLKPVKFDLYLKNNENFNGNANDYKNLFGSVRTCFYSNTKFLSCGKQYINEEDKSKSLLFERKQLKLIENN